ncbi:unnamed protein product [Phaedon cochleariae]|uniref:Adenylate kinase 9 n=1 Tax=Phaedon cochleariae TaxID=80249 RepID=A0A9N9X413_PHACE|nr:unnamed protein product [Phaedon cochleariae]
MCNIKEQQTDYYIREKDHLTNFKSDQTIIINDCNLNQITGINIPKETHSACPPLEEWYPYCNSYYPYAEDVDPLERVNHILGSKPSFVSLTSLDAIGVLRESSNYSEKLAQLQYLESNPVCFIILGKPGIGEQELGKRLAEYWQCVYIEPEILIEQEIDNGTRVGQCIEFNLRCGRAIGVDVILRLVEKRVNSESAKHRGFVICGLPLIPNDLYEEDPISSESAVFTVKEMFEEVIDATIEIGMPPSSRHEVTISSKYTSEAGEPGEGGEDDKENPAEDEEAPGEGEGTPVKQQSPPKLAPQIPPDLGGDYDVCQPPEIGIDFEHQLNFLFDLLKPPFLIIYIMCSTEDVINKRFNYRYDVYSNLNVDLLSEKTKQLFYDLFSRQRGKANEDIPDEFFDSGLYNPDTSNPIDPVLLPEHFPSHVSTQLDNYRYTAMNFIENRILLHDPQYFVKVDGRTSVQRMFHLLKARMKILPLQRVILPKKLNAIEDIVDTGEGELLAPSSNHMSLEDCYRLFSKRDTPSVSFRWNWSDWGTKCPVSMKNGRTINGQPDFGVHFMNRIFFLADEQAFIKFYRNPRPFLLPPLPKSSCKIFIFGPKCSGKTAIAKCLAYFLNGTVLCIEHMMKDFLMQKEDEHREQIRQAAFIEGIQLLNEIRAGQAEEQEKSRIEQIKEWAMAVRDLIQNLIQLIDEKDREQTVTKFEISSFPMAMKKVDFVEIETETTIAIKKVRDQLDQYKIPFSYDVLVLKNLLKDRKKFFSYLPDNLKKKVAPKPASVLDDFVIDYANRAVENADLDHIDINNKNVVDMFISTMRNVEDAYIEQGNNRGGWVLDGMISDTAILDELYPDYIADEIILLKDTGNFEFLTQRFSDRGENTFTNYREFFMSLGNIDAAWRAPSEMSTTSYKTHLARSILSEIFDNTLESSKMAVNISTRSQSYQEEVSQFYKQWPDTKNYFEKLGHEVLEIEITNKSLPELMMECIRIIEDRYRVKASTFSEEDRADEVKDFGDETVQEEEMAEGPITARNPDEDSIQKNRRYGDTFYYCPVTFKDHWVLWKGKEDLAVKFRDQVYLLSCEADMEKFLLSPRNYLTNAPPKTIPPPRICVVGVKGSGKTTMSQYLANSYGLSYISYSSILKKSFGISPSHSLEELRRDKQANMEVFNYLTYNYPLKDNFYVNNLSSLWFSYPTNQIGFVIDDFPKRPSDIEFMTKYKLIPDIVIHLGGDETKIKKRLLDIHRRNWDERMEMKRKQLAELDHETNTEWEEKRMKRYQELLEQKRETRYAKKKSEKATANDLTAISQVSVDSIAEQRDIDEINRMLDIELPETSPHQPLETFEDDNYEVLITDDITIESGFLSDIQSACDVELIPFTKIEVDLDQPDLTLRRALFITDSIKHRTLSIFERCYDVSSEVADRLLSSGYYFLSKFGRSCPVQYYENRNPFPMLTSAEDHHNVFPIIHRSYIYYIVGDGNVAKFKKDPLRYVLIDRVALNLRPFKTSIIGPPKCGKSTLAQRIKDEYGMKVITRGQAARYVLTYLPFSSLTEKMELLLRNGMELTDDLIARCVEAASFDARAITQGVIYDGFPNSVAEVKNLSYLGMVPNLVIDLRASEDEILECLARDIGRRGFPRFSRHFVHHLWKEWTIPAASFRKWYDREYQVTSEISIETSNWSVWKQTRDLMVAVFFEIQHYYNHAGNDWPVRLANMQVTPLEFLERQSSYKSFCPCCIHFSNELHSGGEPPDRTGLVQWRYSYYWLCPDHIEIFLETPDAFLPPYIKHSLPLDLPSIQTLNAIPENVFEDGNCLVCYKNLRALIKGSIDYSLCYKNKTYLFTSEECLREFMRQPWMFPAEISFKPPGGYSSLGYRELPILGMLEQYVATPVIKALGFISRRRPVIPGLSIASSAAIGVGLFLKVHNERLSPELRPMYRRGDDLYRQRMEKLISYLDRMKSVINPYLHYEEPIPKFSLLESVKSESTESVATAISKIVHDDSQRSPGTVLFTHAFTGCDTISVPFGQGKIKFTTLLSKSEPLAEQCFLAL